MTCHKCSVCVGASHHWVPDPQEDANAPDYGCKHCEARGVECPECEGEGCEACKYEGVVPAAAEAAKGKSMNLPRRLEVHLNSGTDPAFLIVAEDQPTWTVALAVMQGVGDEALRIATRLVACWNYCEGKTIRELRREQ